MNGSGQGHHVTHSWPRDTKGFFRLLWEQKRGQVPHHHHQSSPAPPTGSGRRNCRGLTVPVCGGGWNMVVMRAGTGGGHSHVLHKASRGPTRGSPLPTIAHQGASEGPLQGLTRQSLLQLGQILSRQVSMTLILCLTKPLGANNSVLPFVCVFCFCLDIPTHPPTYTQTPAK